MCIRDSPKVCPKPLSRGSKVTLETVSEMFSTSISVGTNKSTTDTCITAPLSSYFEYNSTIRFSLISALKSDLSGTDLNTPLKLFSSTSSQSQDSLCEDSSIAF